MKDTVGRNILIGVALCMVMVWLFGIFFMHKIDDHGSSGCFAAVASNTDCPQTMSALGYIAFHADIFHIFSNGVPAGSLIALFFLLLLVFLTPLVSITFPPAFFRAPSRRGNIFHSIIPDYFLRWFAMYEKRDPLVSCS